MSEYAFPDEQASSTENDVLSWRELTLDMWFHIINEKNIEKKDGECIKILTLSQEGGATCKI